MQKIKKKLSVWLCRALSFTPSNCTSCTKKKVFKTHTIKRLIFSTMTVVFLSVVPMLQSSAEATNTAQADVVCDSDNIWILNKNTEELYIVGKHRPQYGLQEQSVTPSTPTVYGDITVRKLLKEKELLHFYNEVVEAEVQPFLVDEIHPTVAKGVHPYYDGDAVNTRMNSNAAYGTALGTGYNYSKTSYSMPAGTITGISEVYRAPYGYANVSIVNGQLYSSHWIMDTITPTLFPYEYEQEFSGEFISTPTNVLKIEATGSAQEGSYFNVLLDDGSISALHVYPEITQAYAMKQAAENHWNITKQAMDYITPLESNYKFKDLSGHYALDINGKLHEIVGPNISDVLLETEFTEISTHGEHCLALDVDGNIWAWGKNDHNQCGSSTQNDIATPTQITHDRVYTSISAGIGISAAVDTDGKVYVWGDNNQDALGFPDDSGIGDVEEPTFLFDVNEIPKYTKTSYSVSQPPTSTVDGDLSVTDDRTGLVSHLVLRTDENAAVEYMHSVSDDTVSGNYTQTTYTVSLSNSANYQARFYTNELRETFTRKVRVGEEFNLPIMGSRSGTYNISIYGGSTIQLNVNLKSLYTVKYLQNAQGYAYPVENFYTPGQLVKDLITPTTGELALQTIYESDSETILPDTYNLKGVNYAVEGYKFYKETFNFAVTPYVYSSLPCTQYLPTSRDMIAVPTLVDKEANAELNAIISGVKPVESSDVNHPYLMINEYQDDVHNTRYTAYNRFYVTSIEELNNVLETQFSKVTYMINKTTKVQVDEELDDGTYLESKLLSQEESPIVYSIGEEDFRNIQATYVVGIDRRGAQITAVIFNIFEYPIPELYTDYEIVKLYSDRSTLVITAKKRPDIGDYVLIDDYNATTLTANSVSDFPRYIKSNDGKNILVDWTWDKFGSHSVYRNAIYGTERKLYAQWVPYQENGEVKFFPMSDLTTSENFVPEDVVLLGCEENTMLSKFFGHTTSDTKTNIYTEDVELDKLLSKVSRSSRKQHISTPIQEVFDEYRTSDKLYYRTPATDTVVSGNSYKSYPVILEDVRNPNYNLPLPTKGASLDSDWTSIYGMQLPANNEQIAACVDIAAYAKLSVGTEMPAGLVSADGADNIVPLYVTKQNVDAVPTNISELDAAWVETFSKGIYDNSEILSNLGADYDSALAGESVSTNFVASDASGNLRDVTIVKQDVTTRPTTLADLDAEYVSYKVYPKSMFSDLGSIINQTAYTAASVGELVPTDWYGVDNAGNVELMYVKKQAANYTWKQLAANFLFFADNETVKTTTKVTSGEDFDAYWSTQGITVTTLRFDDDTPVQRTDSVFLKSDLNNYVNSTYPVLATLHFADSTPLSDYYTVYSEKDYEYYWNSDVMYAKPMSMGGASAWDYVRYTVNFGDFSSIPAHTPIDTTLVCKTESGDFESVYIVKDTNEMEIYDTYFDGPAAFQFIDGTPCGSNNTYYTKDFYDNCIVGLNPMEMFYAQKTLTGNVALSQSGDTHLQVDSPSGTLMIPVPSVEYAPGISYADALVYADKMYTCKLGDVTRIIKNSNDITMFDDSDNVSYQTVDAARSIYHEKLSQYTNGFLADKELVESAIMWSLLSGEDIDTVLSYEDFYLIKFPNESDMKKVRSYVTDYTVTRVSKNILGDYDLDIRADAFRLNENADKAYEYRTTDITAVSLGEPAVSTWELKYDKNNTSKIPVENFKYTSLGCLNDVRLSVEYDMDQTVNLNVDAYQSKVGSTVQPMSIVLESLSGKRTDISKSAGVTIKEVGKAVSGLPFNGETVKDIQVSDSACALLALTEEGNIWLVLYSNNNSGYFIQQVNLPENKFKSIILDDITSDYIALKALDVEGNLWSTIYLNEYGYSSAVQSFHQVTKGVSWSENYKYNYLIDEFGNIWYLNPSDLSLRKLTDGKVFTQIVQGDGIAIALDQNGEMYMAGSTYKCFGAIREGVDVRELQYWWNIDTAYHDASNDYVSKFAKVSDLFPETESIQVRDLITSSAFIDTENRLWESSPHQAFSISETNVKDVWGKYIIDMQGVMHLLDGGDKGQIQSMDNIVWPEFKFSSLDGSGYAVSAKTATGELVLLPHHTTSHYCTKDLLWGFLQPAYPGTKDDDDLITRYDVSQPMLTHPFEYNNLVKRLGLHSKDDNTPQLFGTHDTKNYDVSINFNELRSLDGIIVENGDRLLMQSEVGTTYFKITEATEQTLGNYSETISTNNVAKESMIEDVPIVTNTLTIPKVQADMDGAVLYSKSVYASDPTPYYSRRIMMDVVPLKALTATYTGDPLPVGTEVSTTELDFAAVYEDDTVIPLAYEELTEVPATMKVTEDGFNAFPFSYEQADDIAIVMGITPPPGRTVTSVSGNVPNSVFVGDNFLGSDADIVVTYDDATTASITYAELDAPILDTRVTAVGINNYPITVNGVTGNLTVNGYYYDTLSANYMGDPIPVGSKYDKTDVEVTLNYTPNNVGKVPVLLQATEWLASSEDVMAVGANNYTATLVSDNSISGNYTVQGTATVVSISANYIGPDVLKGSAYDKDNVVVTALYSDTSTSVIPSADWSVDSVSVNAVGTNTFTATYSGETTTFDVVGYNNPNYIIATYNGPDLPIGSSYSKNDVLVSLTYDNGETSTLDNADWTESGTVINTVGTNIFTATHLGLSDNFSVTGFKEAASLEATYTGVPVLKGEAYSKDDVKVDVTYTDATTETLASSDWVASSVSVNAVGPNTFTATYNGVSDDYSVPGYNNPKYIRATYNGDSIPVGDTYNKADVLVEVVYDNNETFGVPDGDWTADETLVSKVGVNTYTATYLGLTTDYAIDGFMEVASLSANYVGQPIIVGNSYSKDDVEVIVTYTDNSTETVSANAWVASGLVVTDIGDNSYTATYSGKTSSYTVTGYNDVVSMVASYTGPNIILGNSYSKTDVKVDVTRSNGTVSTLTQDDWIASGTTVTQVGANTYTATYAGLTASYNVVGYNDIVELQATYKGAAIQCGESYSKSDVTVIVTYSDATQNTLNTADWAADSLVVTQVGTNVFTAEYNGMTASYSVSGFNDIVSLTATYAGPDIVIGKNYDKANVTVTALYTDGTTAAVPASQWQESALSVPKVGVNNYVATYNSKSANYSITGYNKVETLEATYTGKPVVIPSVYAKDNVRVELVYSNGSKETISSNSWTASDLNVTKVGDNTYTATSTGLSTTYKVPGIASVTGLTATYTGNSILVGADYSKDNVKVIASYNDGTTVVVQSKDWSANSTRVTAVGDNQFTAAYGTLTATYNVPGHTTTPQEIKNNVVIAFKTGDSAFLLIIVLSCLGLLCLYFGLLKKHK